jgi:Mn2+/Fe2+ NRAMP family transporter
MLYSDVSAWFIILATAVTLHVAGVTDIKTAGQAASALRPLAGDGAFLLFAAGIMGVGLIGVPVLAGASAYAFSEAMGWREGLEKDANHAKGFYGVIALTMAVGVALQWTPITPMKALFWSAVINGVTAVPLMAVILILAAKKSVMGDHRATPSLIVLGWIATAVMGVAAVMMFVPA